MPKALPEITADRAMAIVNHVAEEFADHQQTFFATKVELCQTIQWLRKHQWEELQRKDEALDDIAIDAFKRCLYDISLKALKARQYDLHD